MGHKPVEVYDSGVRLNRGIKAMIFDLDGTLVDTVDLHINSWIRTCEIMGMEVPSVDYVRSLMGMRALDIAARLCGQERAREALAIKNRVYESLITNVRPVSGAAEVLSSLKRRGYLVGVVTSSVRSIARKSLEAAGLLQYVDALVAGDEVSRGKPDPEPLLKLLSNLKLNVDDVVVVGDTLYDIMMGINAGVKLVILLKTRDLKSVDNVPVNVVIINSLTELLELIKQ
ncbi:HAD family hydrolase [Vulcanisaeta thermophila]|uniref:HAD family hydrolase n=1 Tax=Vulcanisaeta thermophila TaxID=867917 RepID=UPI000853D3E6|nr:HAD-IA family hydrolase [Vulcanisaeta thermophila]